MKPAVCATWALGGGTAAASPQSPPPGNGTMALEGTMKTFYVDEGGRKVARSFRKAS